MQEQQGEYRDTIRKIILQEISRQHQLPSMTTKMKQRAQTDAEYAGDAISFAFNNPAAVEQTYLTKRPTQQIANGTSVGYDKHQSFTSEVQNAKIMDNALNSGGDADRHRDFFKSIYCPLPKYCYTQEVAAPTTDTPPLMSPGAEAIMRKYKSDLNSNPPSIVDTDAFPGCGYRAEQMGDLYNISEGSVKSESTSKTAISRKSSHELKRLVKSQCKLHSEINDTLSALNANNENKEHFESKGRTVLDVDLPAKPSSLTLQPSGSKDKNVIAELENKEIFQDGNTDTLTITVDDIVSSKIINPMIRKMQRMYLDNLRGEMSLMEDLEHIPHQVSEVCKATMFKKKG
ncbi:uncharacterized protein LOC106087299 [Stomoxys calcitrans]|uniref:uncharacterized protein LOC106087299 n=1 Tax=Stomoxys calcitrans TaxID=35570 RepID=UPI0027E28A87|nr:uncharacterized protein LOC106087299 [Stomoxys calcitrans]